MGYRLFPTPSAVLQITDMEGIDSVSQFASMTTRALEKHYKVAEVAELWAMSEKSVRTIFASEPGVLKIERPELLHKRGYCSLFIPESTLLSVHRRLSS